MCGLVGYVDFSGARIDASKFDRMTDLIAHRGPDGEGVKHLGSSDLSVGLGHRRLSIQDLSPAGAQPMETGDGAFWIVFNGEVYNFREIRSTLEAKGYYFRSGTDTEVILNAYREWGEDCVQRFNGMFAFAIWDNKEQSLFLCRDRLGVKPLYYTVQGSRIIFASEIKSILAAPGVEAAPDWHALHNPWRFQVAPGTGFQNINKLAPGHSAKYTRQGIKIKSWWSISATETDPGEHEAINQLNELLESAVKLNMVSDVPVGAFLSGGLDSSAIVALAAQLVDRPIDTFTIRFKDKDNAFEAMPDESVYAREVANQFGCNHREVEIAPNVVDLLPKMVWHMDEPISDPAAINSYLISQGARDAGVTVLLSGMGGDEVFGGYRKHLACLLAERYQKWTPAIMRRGVESLVNQLPVASGTRGYKTLRWAKRFISFASMPQTERFLMADLSVPPNIYGELFRDTKQFPYESSPGVLQHLQYLQQRGVSYLTRMCLADTYLFLPEHNMTYTDKSAMAAGIEVRPPLVDHRIVEYLFTLAPRYRINGRVQKYLLKKAMEPTLTKRIIYRPKGSFSSPIRAWVRGSLRPMVDDLLNPAELKKTGLYESDAVWRMVNDDRAGRADNALLIWTLLTNQLWFKTFVENKP